MATKRTYAPAVTRGKLLDVAYALIQKSGYGGMTLAQIASAAGVTNGALFHHFGSKQQLAIALIRERIADSLERHWLAPLRDAPNAKAGVAAIMQDIAADSASEDPILGCPLNNVSIELAMLDPAFRQAVAELFETWHGTIAGKLAADKAAGRIQEEVDEQAVAAFVVASYEGAMTLARSLQTVRPIEDCARQLDAHLSSIETA